MRAVMYIISLIYADKQIEFIFAKIYLFPDQRSNAIMYYDD